MEFILAAILGVIQGISEWLPISSTGHLILFDEIWSMSDPAFFSVFKVVIQFGSIIAVCVLYFRTLNPFISTKTISEKRETWILWTKIVVGSSPLFVGLALDGIMEKSLSGPIVIAAALIVYGIVFLLIERKKHTPKITSLSQLDYKTAFFVGSFQILAIVPGTSRSGSTMIGGSLFGCSRKVTSEFSFFLAIPAMVAASGLKMVKFVMDYGMFSLYEIGLLLVGTFVSFVISIFAIRFLLNYIRNHDFKAFGVYRIVLGIIVILSVLF